jgi:hypothetical protein
MAFSRRIVRAQPLVARELYPSAVHGYTPIAAATHALMP